MSEDVQALVLEREFLRRQKKFAEADELRRRIEALGQVLVDTPQGATVEAKKKPKKKQKTHGIVAIFGSGELSTVGRSVHERLIARVSPPVAISLLQTPAGYEANPHHWYKKMADMLQIGLKNYKPEITLVPALTREGEKSTNDPVTLAPLLAADYIHTGAGSPTYAARHLKDTKAIEIIRKRIEEGASFSVASAAAMAFSLFVLPVYEIYRAGEDLHWKEGLNLFADWDIPITIIPHWNNVEGGEDIDTRFAFMGEKRFEKMLALLPAETMVMGIDEHTMVLLNTRTRTAEVTGVGTITLFSSHKKENARTVRTGESFPFSWLLLE